MNILKIFALVKEDIGKFVEDLIDNFRNCFKIFVMDNGLIFLEHMGSSSEDWKEAQKLVFGEGWKVLYEE